MITSHQDYLDYLEADRVSLNRTQTLKALLFDEVWRFQRLLRRLEYLTNCKKNRFLRAFIAHRYHKQALKLGFTIPINVFGPGLSIAHPGTIVVNSGAKVGANCRLHVCVNIGTEAGKGVDAPTIGDNCYIAPGVKMYGRIVIGDNMVIGANAVVNKSFEEGNATLGGIPAKVISEKTSDGLLTKGFKRP
ncbi:MAG TPA: hypothetical protein PLV58_10540 [Campylobacterales bacterium]|nr:hypothetical protein [Campylobacterales bacterium]